MTLQVCLEVSKHNILLSAVSGATAELKLRRDLQFATEIQRWKLGVINNWR